MSKILLTGFGLFGANPYNPTKDVAEYIGSKKKFADSKIEIAILPVTFGTAAEILLRYASKEKVRAVISLGLSGAARSKNAEIYLETKAKNIMNAKNPDNNGYRPQEVEITPYGPETVDCPWNAESIAIPMNFENIPVVVSDDAGKYVCNDLIYRVSHTLDVMNSDIKFGFMHIPWLEEYQQDKFKPTFDKLKKEGKFNFEEKALLSLEQVVQAIGIAFHNML